jgi:hypothetical protein
MKEQIDVITKNIANIISQNIELDLVLGYKSTLSITPNKISKQQQVIVS